MDIARYAWNRTMTGRRLVREMSVRNRTIQSYCCPMAHACAPAADKLNQQATLTFRLDEATNGPGPTGRLQYNTVMHRNESQKTDGQPVYWVECIPTNLFMRKK